MRIIYILLLFLLAVPQGAFCGSGEPQLKKVVVLSRHGIRAPTQDAKILSQWSEKEWPVWPVKHGDLTPRGAELVKGMWSALKPSLAAAGILPESACPAESAVYVRADVDERTRATAAAIIEGIGSGCQMGYSVLPAKVDPLFHPVKAGLYHFDAIPIAMDIIRMSRGGLENLQDELSGGLALIGEISGPPAPSLCSRFALMPKCELTDLPNAVSVSADGTAVRIVGSLGVGSSLAEIFLLEYGEWPNEAAGWGKVNASVLSQVLPVHARVFDLVNRAPVIAWANGGALLSEMCAALFGEHKDNRANEARLVVYVGHDTNIANVGGLLGFNWQASGYPPNGIPPAGALFLELWETGKKQEIRARFYSQPPAVLHRSFDGDGAKPASHAPTAAIVRREDEPAVMTAQEFRQLVASKTQGAPKPGPQKPDYIYSKVD